MLKPSGNRRNAVPRLARSCKSLSFVRDPVHQQGKRYIKASIWAPMRNVSDCESWIKKKKRKTQFGSNLRLSRQRGGGNPAGISPGETRTTCGVDACECNNIYSANCYHIAGLEWYQVETPANSPSLCSLIAPSVSFNEEIGQRKLSPII